MLTRVRPACLSCCIHFFQDLQLTLPAIYTRTAYPTYLTEMPIAGCCAYGVPCCLEQVVHQESLPRHKVLGFEITHDEWLSPVRGSRNL